MACEIIDPTGRKDTIKPRISHADPDGPFLVEYTPKIEGQHKVVILFAGQPIPSSPFSVNVGPRKCAFYAFKPASLFCDKGVWPKLLPSSSGESAKGKLKAS